MPELLLLPLLALQLQLVTCGESTFDGAMLFAQMDTSQLGSVHGELLRELQRCVEQRLSAAEVRMLLRFCTGLHTLPCRGLSQKITVTADVDSTERLPQASTCARELFIPLYSDGDALYEKLRYALKHTTTDGFGYE